jgi:hypothetical protein
MAIFYDKLNNKKQAIKFYNKSLRAKSEDFYLQATTYRKLATIYFDKAKYQMAGQYYDSTLTKLVKKNREYFAIVKKRENLNDVIKYEGLVQKNDSILNLVAMSANDRKSFFEKHIQKIKAKEEAKKLLQEKQKLLAQNASSGIQDVDIAPKRLTKGNIQNEPLSIGEPPSIKSPAVPQRQGQSSFYFYNQATVAFGKLEFQKRWGKRQLKDNWRWFTQDQNTKTTDDLVVENTTEKPKTEAELEKYNPDFYINQLPTSQKVLDSLAKDRNFANYQLGVIYKEKFSEYALSANKLETLLQSKPEERLILPAMYNLYKVYEIINKPKAETIKNQIILNYPDTRYAQILSGKISEEKAIADSPSEQYKNLYKQFENQEYCEVLETIQKNLTQFEGDELIPKYELLKANVTGKLKGLDEYKKALNYVAVTYPNNDEGIRAEEILSNNIPKLDQMNIISNDSLSKSWKLLYKVGYKNEPTTKILIEKINKYITEKKYDNYKVSFDVYNETENFVVVHGITSREYANFFMELLRDTKEYKVTIPAMTISAYNYSVIQIKKNYNQYIEVKI